MVGVCMDVKVSLPSDFIYLNLIESAVGPKNN